MLPLQHDQRAEPGRLQAGAEQHRQVETGSQPLLADLARGADALAAADEGGRRVDVAQVHAADRVPDRLRLFPDAGLAAALVALERVWLAACPQEVRGGVDDAGDRRVVRLDEGGEDVGDARGAAPLVEGQDADVLGELADDLVPAAGRERHRAAGRFGQARQEWAVDGDVQIVEGEYLAGCEARSPPCPRAQHRGL